MGNILAWVRFIACIIFIIWLIYIMIHDWISMKNTSDAMHPIFYEGLRCALDSDGRFFDEHAYLAYKSRSKELGRLYLKGFKRGKKIVKERF